MRKNIIVWDSIDWADYTISKNLHNCNFFDGCSVTRDKNTAKSSPHKKVVVVHYWYGNFSLLAHEMDLSWADLIICTSLEYPVNDLVTEEEYVTSKLNNSNVIFLFGDCGHNISVTHPRFFLKMHTFLSYVEYGNPYMPHCGRDKRMFDCLLGTKRHHRDFLFDKLAEAQLLDRCYISYFDRSKGIREVIYETQNLNRLEHPQFQHFVKDNPTDFFTMNLSRLPLRGTNSSVICSALVPQDIYDHSNYSIVTETCTVWPFITEKTAKVLFAKRLFVMFAAQWHLQKLRNLGFETFNGIIDETYDKIDNEFHRYEQAWEQITFLLDNDPTTILNKAQPIVDHNKNHLTTSRIKTFHDARQFIQDHLDNL